MPEMEYESNPDAKTVKKEPDSEGGFPPVDKRVSDLFINNNNNHLVTVKIIEL